jgi:hypothetical protein
VQPVKSIECRLGFLFNAAVGQAEAAYEFGKLRAVSKTDAPKGIGISIRSMKAVHAAAHVTVGTSQPDLAH